MSKQQASDKFQLVTDKIISLIEQGTPPWRKPWHSAPYQNLINGHHYTGINPILCTIDSIIYNYEQPFFASFTQAKQLNWKIKKGSKSTWIRWGGTNCKETTNEETGETKKEFYNAFKWFNVFNLACLDDTESEVKISDRLKELTPIVTPNTEDRIPMVETFIKQHNPTTQFGGDRALYHPGTDTIRLPHYQDFTSTSAYYATYLHELVHWTGHQSRCDRLSVGQFGSQSYAFEELIAELGAAMVCNHLGIDSELEHHASYLSSWLEVCRKDKMIFFKAAQKATTAANYLTLN